MEFGSTDVEEKFATIATALITFTSNTLTQLIEDNRKLSAELANTRTQINLLEEKIKFLSPEPALSQK